MTADKLAVTFDLWQTLILDAPEQDELRSQMRYKDLHKALTSLGVHLSLQELKRGHDESASRLQEIWKRNQDVAVREQIRLIMELASNRPGTMPTEPEAIEKLESAYVHSLSMFPPKLNPGTLDILKALRSRGHKIGLISNTGRSPGEALRRLLENYGVLQFFNATVFSNEVGVRKPDRRIFEEAANGLGVDLEGIVHIGDDPEADIWGAKQLGMRTILYESGSPDLVEWPPNSLYVLTRLDRRIPESEMKPDGQVSSLTEALGLIKSFS